ncbi:hypothetical protein HYY70_03585 [Candidatus Woesearchaeota archaeon]|nr:hypothetical protein [Candidatus Woesearchaeota archaeon]
MRIHQQFDLKIDKFNEIHKVISEAPSLVEKLTKELIGQGYQVIMEGANQIGLPRSIIVIKEFTGPFATLFSTKIRNDFNAVSKALGIERVFE